MVVSVLYNRHFTGSQSEYTDKYTRGTTRKKHFNWNEEKKKRMKEIKKKKNNYTLNQQRLKWHILHMPQVRTTVASLYSIRFILSSCFFLFPFNCRDIVLQTLILYLCTLNSMVLRFELHQLAALQPTTTKNTQWTNMNVWVFVRRMKMHFNYYYQTKFSVWCSVIVSGQHFFFLVTFGEWQREWSCCTPFLVIEYAHVICFFFHFG